MASLESKLKKDGWEVRKSKVDGGCYEVYGTDPKGNAVAAVNLRCIEGIDLAAVPVHHYDGRVEAYFHPVSFKMLLSSRRGEVLYKAN